MWRLERFGYDTYDYTLGKADWIAAGCPTVRSGTPEPRAVDALDTDVVTCGPGDVVGAVASQTGTDVCVVINEHRIVLGRLGAEELRAPPDTPVEAVMQPGPGTVRAHEPLDALLRRMVDHHIPVLIVTTPEGRLLGLVHGADEQTPKD